MLLLTGIAADFGPDSARRTAAPSRLDTQSDMVAPARKQCVTSAESPRMKIKLDDRVP